MLSSILTKMKVFKLERTFNPPTPKEIHNIFRPLEKVRIKTKNKNFLKKLKGESSINGLNEEDAAQFIGDFENLSLNVEEKQINKINFERFVNRRDQINFYKRSSFPEKDLDQR